jgi:type II secretory pathway predicted ATPase ExeA/outer membrane protein OmpA-like peptidoglycan-associated protein
LYAEYYGLSREPFSLSPDPRFCYRHPTFAKAKAYFEFAIHRGEGFVVVTGRPGTGKSTLVQDLIGDLRKASRLVARIDKTQVEAEDLLRLVAYAFGVDPQGLDKASLLNAFEQFMLRRGRPGKAAILVVDEAQNLPSGALEELRLITNLTCETHPLAQVFLVGQEELRAKIQSPNLEQLRQRVLASCHLEPLNGAETRGYVEHRLLCAGWSGDPLIRGEALGVLFSATGGIPRLVNKFCARLLVHGYVEGRHALSGEDASIVLGELRDEWLQYDDPMDSAFVQLRGSGKGAEALPDLSRPPPSHSQVAAAAPAATPAQAGEGHQAAGRTGEMPVTIARGSPARGVQGREQEIPLRRGREATAAAGNSPSGVLSPPPPSGVPRIPSEPTEDEHRLPLSHSPDARRVLGSRRAWWAGALAAAMVLAAVASGVYLARSSDPDLGPFQVSRSEQQSAGKRAADPGNPRNAPVQPSGGRHLIRDERAGLLATGRLREPRDSPESGPGKEVKPPPALVGAVAAAETKPLSPQAERQGGGTDKPAGGETQPRQAAAGKPVSPASQPASEQRSGSPGGMGVAGGPASGRPPDTGPAPHGISQVPEKSGGEVPTQQETAAPTDTAASGPDRPGRLSGTALVSVGATHSAEQPGGGTAPFSRSRTRAAAAHGGSGGRRGTGGSQGSPGQPSAPETTPLGEQLHAAGLPVEQIRAGAFKLNLHGDVQFPVDSATLPEAAHGPLDRVAGILAQFPDARIRIVGRADHRGPMEYNRRLSLLRAKAVAEYFRQRGVDKARITVEGRGEDQEVKATSGTARSLLAFERRVDLIIAERESPSRQSPPLEQAEANGSKTGMSQRDR